jgi:hypothetical protein
MAAWDWDLYTPGFAIIISWGLFFVSLEYSLILGLHSGSLWTFILCGCWQCVAVDFFRGTFYLSVQDYSEWGGAGHALTQLIIDPQQGRTRLWTEPRGQVVEELLQYGLYC